MWFKAVVSVACLATIGFVGLSVFDRLNVNASKPIEVSFCDSVRQDIQAYRNETAIPSGKSPDQIMRDRDMRCPDLPINP